MSLFNLLPPNLKQPLSNLNHCRLVLPVFEFHINGLNIVHGFWEGDPLSSTYHTVLRSIHVFVYVSIYPARSRHVSLVITESLVSSQTNHRNETELPVLA